MMMRRRGAGAVGSVDMDQQRDGRGKAGASETNLCRARASSHRTPGPRPTLKLRARHVRVGQYARPDAMTTSAIGKLLDSYLTDLEGEDGFWRGMREDVQLFVLSDESHDRMRI